MKSIITKKDVMYNLRISNLLLLPKQIHKDLVFTLLVFVPVTMETTTYSNPLKSTLRNYITWEEEGDEVQWKRWQKNDLGEGCNQKMMSLTNFFSVIISSYDLILASPLSDGVLIISQWETMEKSKRLLSLVQKILNMTIF